MFKKFLVLLLLSGAVFAKSLKDANLITFDEYKKISTFSQKKKAFCNNKEHKKFQNFLTAEEYDVYLIIEKILRANKLQYKNWRIGFNLEKDIINAISLNNNLILINSSLYDSLHQNKDAIAFALCHELAHFLLSHQKETIENTYKIKKLENDIKKLNQQKHGEIYSRNLKNLINNIYLAQRNLELKCDSLALELLLRAGYNLDLALEIFDYFDEDYSYLENKNTYPLIYERKENLLSEIEFLNVENLKLEGENNLFDSKVLTIQKSMDKQTLIVNKPENYKEYAFSPKTKNQKILSKAYYFYKKEDMKNAIKFFNLAYKENPNNYIAPLYLSYAYEADGNIKLAKRYIKKARSLKPRDEIIVKQYKTLYKKD